MILDENQQIKNHDIMDAFRSKQYLISIFCAAIEAI